MIITSFLFHYRFINVPSIFILLRFVFFTPYEGHYLVSFSAGENVYVSSVFK